MSDVPYGEIDCEVRRLVWLLNQFPGIATEFSCAGHFGQGLDLVNGQGYVSFRAESQDSLHAVAVAISPCLNWRASLVENLPLVRAAWLDLRLDLAGRLAYALRWAGSPEFAQRALIRDLEQALAAGLAKAGATP